MDCESNRKMWADALRSGDYPRGHGGLRSTDGKFCPLGVLCDVYRRETGHDGWAKGPCGKWLWFDSRGIAWAGSAPAEVAEWVGMGHIEMELVMESNDLLGAPFENVAVAVERGLRF